MLAPLPPTALVERAPRLFQQLENLAHPLLLALLAHLWLTAWQPRAGLPECRRLLTVLACLALAGAILELLQMHVGARDPSLQDAAANTLGAAFGVFWHSSLRPVFRWSLLVALLLVAIAPLTWALLAYAHRASEAPVLWRPDSKLSAYFASWGSGQYPGLSVNEPLPDWRAFRELRVLIENPHPLPIHVKLRVNDRRHDERYEDRYNQEFELPATSITTLSVPLDRIKAAPAGRKMDMDQIRDLLIFQLASRNEPPPRILEVRLTD